MSSTSPSSSSNDRSGLDSRSSQSSNCRSHKPEEIVSPSIVDEMFCTSADRAYWLAKWATQGIPEHADFEQLSTMLATLPLATDQFGLCMRRLQNPMAYYVAGERGAAAYELNLLGGSLGPRVAKNNDYGG